MSKINDLINELKAPKSQYNSFGKYHYRSNEDIQSALKPLLSKHDLTLSATSEVVLIGDNLVSGVHLSLFDGETEVATGDGYAVMDLNKKGMDKGQATGASFSYASKYAFGQMLLIDDVKDSDGQQPQQPTPARKPSPRKPAPKPKPVITESELRKKVDAGEVTPADANIMVKAGKVELGK